MKEKILVTGGAGFIGSHLIHTLIEEKHIILNIDALKYASSLHSLENFDTNQYLFQKIDLCDKESLDKAATTFDPDYIIHLAAESHVDRSIESSEPFIQSNILGTYNLLEVARKKLPRLKKFIHVSTDEVYGSLEIEDNLSFTEKSQYKPSSPYSASKAASDHLAHAWYITYGVPCVITNCSNNYGPRQYPEKLIPVVISSAINGKKIPIYGNGENQRDWIHVKDHCSGLRRVMKEGRVGETYLIGTKNVLSNNDLVRKICEILDKVCPNSHGLETYADLITYIDDRLGHDKRYAIDPSKIEQELGWKGELNFSDALEDTVEWYLENEKWLNK